jgi:predicted DNA binding protein
VKKKIEDQPWWPKLVAEKDAKSLRELSAEFGVSPAAISNALKRNNLTRTSARSGPRKYRAAAPAAKLRPVRKVFTKKASPAKRVSSKKMSMLAEAAAAKARAPKAPVRRAAVGRRRKGRVSVLAQYQDQMGKVVDRVIAEKAGVTVSAVTNYRKRHQIAPATGRGRPRRSPAAPAADRASSRRRVAAQAYSVEIAGEKVVVVASSIVEAAQRASAAGRGEVTKIKLLGPAIV